MPTPPKEGKLLYHMTRLENMPSILEHALLSRKQAEERRLLSMDIADHEILAERENFWSPRPLSEYVPFHFFVKNPFDGRVCRQYGSENMVIIAITREWAQSLSSSYIVTAHPLHPSAQCLPYNEGYDAIDWFALESRDYYNNDTKQKCMAECLIPDGVAPEEFACIYVYTDEAKEELLKYPNSWRVKHYPERYIQVAPYMFP